MIASPKASSFASAVRAYRETPVYRVMVRNHASDADECIAQHLSRTQANAEAQRRSVLGNTAWVVERFQ